MIRLRHADGRTTEHPAPVKPNGHAQRDVTSASLVKDALEVALCAPRGFRTVVFSAEDTPEGERLIVYLDDVRLEILAHSAHNRVRIDVRRQGKPRMLAGG